MKAERQISSRKGSELHDTRTAELMHKAQEIQLQEENARNERLLKEMLERERDGDGDGGDGE